MKKLILIVALLTSMPVCGQTHAPKVEMTKGAVAMGCVGRYVTYDHLTQGEYDALVDFAFNVGCGALYHSTLLRKLNHGDATGAYNEFMKWTYAGHPRVQLRGLVRRRKVEQAMWRGVYDANPNPSLLER